MKSSTLRRSTLSRENMEVIENLAKDQNNEEMISEYVRPDEYESVAEESSNMSQEIDLLWQNIKTTQFNTNSPIAQVVAGFVAGVLSTLLVMFCINTVANKQINITPTTPQVQEQTLEQQPEESAQDNVVPAETTEDVKAVDSQETEQPTVDNSKMVKYIVKNGDTVEAIIKKHYGSYSPDKAELIMKANNLKTLDRINIDQELLIPME